MASKQQTKLIKKYQDDGWIVIKLISTNRPGIPDLLCLKNGKAEFVESKEENDQLSVLQRHTIEKLLRAGFDCFINENPYTGGE